MTPSEGPIAEGRLMLSEVVAAVGFSDRGRLTHHFRRIVGVIPGRLAVETARMSQVASGT